MTSSKKEFSTDGLAVKLWGKPPLYDTLPPYPVFSGPGSFSSSVSELVCLSKVRAPVTPFPIMAIKMSPDVAKCALVVHSPQVKNSCLRWIIWNKGLLKKPGCFRFFLFYQALLMATGMMWVTALPQNILPDMPLGLSEHTEATLPIQPQCSTSLALDLGLGALVFLGRL